MAADPRELVEAGVTRVRVHYSDFHGTPRAKLIPIELLEDAAGDGLNFCVAVFAIDHTGVMPDGTGLRDEVNFRDMQVKADLSTLRLLPWEEGTAICIGDCYLDGEPLEADPRGMLRRAIAAAEAAGMHLMVGHELEFFLFRRGPDGSLERYQPVPGLVYRMDPRVDPEGVVRAMEDNVRALGLPFVCTNQEYDPSQWEINTRFGEALTSADEAFLLKLAIKETAAMHGLVATFIGRPIQGGGTSGYHLHFSAWDAAGTNVFEDSTGQYGISDQARHFLGGILAHARGMSAVLAPTVNAYKRFIAQELGPYFVDWGTDNRSVCVRLPAERGKATRLESRIADGSASAYLGEAAHIFAGLDGVQNRLDPGPPTEAIYEPPVERETLPFSLPAALDALEADAYLRGCLGEQFVQGLHRAEAGRGQAVRARRHRLGAPGVRRRPVAGGFPLRTVEGPARTRAVSSLDDAVELLRGAGYTQVERSSRFQARLRSPAGKPPLRLTMTREGRVFGGNYALEISTDEPVLPATNGLTARGRGVVRMKGVGFRARRGDEAGRALADRLSADVPPERSARACPFRADPHRAGRPPGHPASRRLRGLDPLPAAREEDPVRPRAGRGHPGGARCVRGCRP